MEKIMTVIARDYDRKYLTIEETEDGYLLLENEKVLSTVPKSRAADIQHAEFILIHKVFPGWDIRI